MTTKIQRLVAVAVLVMAVLPRAEAQRNLKDIPDPDPVLQLEKLQPQEGLEVGLFASDPMVTKPVNMNWDSRGRLWVVSSPMYPHIKPGEVANDQVVVLEDVDGDGKADRSTVFAEGLHIPTAVMPVEGGAFVANSTELLFIADEDGDLKEDSRTIVLSGFGTEDTHHILHTFGHGPGGLLYFNQSIYIHSHIETPYGVRRLMGGGVWHFRPENRRLEVLSKGLINPWGFAFDRWGQSFATDGAGGEGINYIFPGSVFRTSPGARRVLPGLNPGQPKQCGLCVMETSLFPADWQGSLITCDFRGGRLNRFVLKENGSTYISEKAADPLVSTHRAFRPIDVKVGPDGALYIADWYNPIIQHGEVDFRDPRRDHVHGRIWRLAPKDAKRLAWPDIAGAKTADVIDLLGSGEGQVRHYARLELQGRRDTAAEADRELGKWVEAAENEVEADARSLEALWVRQGLSLDTTDFSSISSVFESADHRIRAAALRVLYQRLVVDEVPEAAELLSSAVKDQHQQVRLWAVCCLRQIGSPEALAIALGVLEQPVDNNLDFALEAFARESKDSWLPEFQQGRLKFGGAGNLIFAMKAAGGNEAFAPLMAALNSGTIPAEEIPAVVETLGVIGNATQLGELAGLLKESGLREHVLDALDGAVTRKLVPGDAAKELLLSLLPEFEGVNKVKGARLAGLWRVEGARPILESMLVSGDVAAAEGLARLGGAESIRAFEKIAGDDNPAAKRAVGVVGRTMMDLNEGAKLAAVVLADLENASEAAPVFHVFLANKNGPKVLAAALKGKKIDKGVAIYGIQRAGTTGGDTGSLIEALKSAGDVRNMDRKLTADEMEDLMEKVHTGGNAARGEQVYRREKLLCIACHAIGETGGTVGPNLVSIGASAPVDYLIDSLLDPNKKIKEGYHMTMITTKEGGLVSGGVEREDDREVVIRDPAGKLTAVPKDQIASKTVSPVSMMPVGLTNSLREDEFVDLVRFMSELGKEGDYKIKPNMYVRQWRVLQNLTNGQMDRIGHLGVESLADENFEEPFFDWSSVTSMVDGSLPLSEVPINWGRGLGISAVQFEIEVGSAGDLSLRIDEPHALRLFVGKREIEIKDGVAQFAAQPGRISCTLVVARRDRPGSRLLVELIPGESDSVSAKPVMKFQ